MTRKTIHVLIAIIVGLVLLLFALRGNEVDGPSRTLLPEFKAVANQVNMLRISKPGGDDVVTMHRLDDKWVVGARDDYAADVGKLRQLVVALAEAKVFEEKTSNPEHHEKLGVGDPEDGGNGIKIVASGPEFSYSVIFGKTAQGDYRYARIDGDAASYLVDQNPDLPTNANDWLLPDIVDIDASDMQRITISHIDGESITIEKSERDQTDFDVIGVPNNRELSYATVGNGIAGALSELELEDVRQGTDAPATTTTLFETWDGLRIVAEVVPEDEISWIRFSAELPVDDPAADDRAAGINERLSGWQYKVADHKTNLLMRRWDDVLKAVE